MSNNSYDPTLLAGNKIMQVKHLCGDVYDSFEFLSEYEIQFALDQVGGNIYRAAAECCRAIASRLARNTDYKFSTLWENSSQGQKQFLKMAEELDERAKTSGGIVPQFVSTADSEPIFDIGDFDSRGTRSDSSTGVFFRD